MQGRKEVSNGKEWKAAKQNAGAEHDEEMETMSFSLPLDILILMAHSPHGIIRSPRTTNNNVEHGQTQTYERKHTYGYRNNWL